MPKLRESLKRALPSFVRDAVVNVRNRLAAGPLEDIVLHPYELVPDPSAGPRLTLVIPGIAPERAFGGVLTGMDIFFGIGKRTGAELRIILDEFVRGVDASIVQQRARAAGLDPAAIEILPRRAETPEVGVRANDVFFSFCWWTTLNLIPLLRKQQSTFRVEPRPLLYPIQEYEPMFYHFSSTHMMARSAFDVAWPCWGMFNTHELYDFFVGQGHTVERAFVFEPKLSNGLRPFLEGETPVKTRRILVYGRPVIPRNCWPAVEKGLRLWAASHPEFAGWEVVSAGLPHPPVFIAANRTVVSLGKLPLEAYAELLRTTAVGLSLMASPHPSYPPLEMAHFGLRTITNTYANKDLASTHPNILSIPDVAPETIAEALASACAAFEAAPAAGWGAPTGRPSFLEPGPFAFLDTIADELTRTVWREARAGQPSAAA